MVVPVPRGVYAEGWKVTVVPHGLALLDEIGRCGDATRQAYTDGVLGLVDQIASILAPADPETARGHTLSLFALLIGTLQLSRALADRQLADEVLARGIENALKLLPGE
jgi:TetR/AcrR family transcriptional regulator, transcriptional repressor for nem operon